MGGKNKSSFAYLTPISILYIGFLILPVTLFLSISVMKYDAFEIYKFQLTGDNFIRIFADWRYLSIIFETLEISAVTTILALLVGYPMGYFIARNAGWAKGILLFLVLAPLMSGDITRTYGWLVILGTNGLLNSFMLSTGVADVPLQILNTKTAVIIALTHINLPFVVFPVFSALAAQEPDLEKAAETLGASKVRSFFEVTLPLSRSGLAIGCVLVFTLTAGAVVTPALLGGTQVQMLGQMVYSLILQLFNWPLASAMALVLVALQFSVVSLYLMVGRRA